MLPSWSKVEGGGGWIGSQMRFERGDEGGRMECTITLCTLQIESNRYPVHGSFRGTCTTTTSPSPSTPPWVALLVGSHSVRGNKHLLGYSVYRFESKCRSQQLLHQDMHLYTIWLINVASTSFANQPTNHQPVHILIHSIRGWW